jgi:hypothetical protein
MNITDICTRVDAQNERSRLVNSVFIRHFQVDEHTVIMTMSRRNFRKASMTCQWTPTKPTRLTKEQKRQYRTGRDAIVAEAFALMGGRIGLIIEM